MNIATSYLFYPGCGQGSFRPPAGGTLFVGVLDGRLAVESAIQQTAIRAGELLVAPSSGVSSVMDPKGNTRGICWHVGEAWIGLQQAPQPMDEVTIIVLDDIARPAPDASVTLTALSYLSTRLGPQEKAVGRLRLDADLASAACQYLQTNLDATITLADLCTRFQCSRTRLARAFRSAGLPSPMQHVAALRVQHASLSLQQSNLNISNIATSVGFRDLPSFSHFFRAHTGYSPREYRQNCLWLQ